VSGSGGALALLGMTLFLPGSAQVMCGQENRGPGAWRVVLCVAICVVGLRDHRRNGINSLNATR